MTEYGISNDGFRVKRQSDISSEISDDLTSQFGNLINLDPAGVWGQIVGIISEREALLWELLQGVYQSQYPSGAEGLAVDNVLALSGMTRLAARASVTDPTPARYADGTTLFGLLLFGTVGTVIPKNAIIRSSSAPQQDFTLDAAVTIQAAVNGQQTLVLSDVPTSGGFSLSLANTGSTLTTRVLSFTSQANVTSLAFVTAPTAGQFQLMLGATLVAALPYSATAAQLQAAIRASNTSFAAMTVAQAGSGFALSWGAGSYNPIVQAAGASLTFPSAPTTGSFVVTVAGSPTVAINVPFQASDIELAIQNLGYLRSRCTANGTNSYAINIDRPTMPLIAVTQNTTGVTPVIGSLNTTGSLLLVADSVQAALNNLLNSGLNQQPYSDAAVIPSSNGFAITFGANPPRTGEPSSAGQPIGLIQIVQSTLQKANAAVNLSVTMVAAGSSAQAVGSATATTKGPIPVVAGKLSVIGSPQGGWSSVTNQLDVLAGADVESDADALVRRNDRLNAKASGPLPSIIDKVSLLAGVTNVVGFENNTNAALQIITFASVPTSGSFALLLAGGQTAAIPFSAGPGAIQSAVSAVTGYQNVSITGSLSYGLSVDFNGAFGSQAQALIQVVNNSTGVSIAAAFGRTPHSIELVVQGGDSAQIAQTIFNAKTAGTPTYGTPAAVVNAAVQQDSSLITVASAVGIFAGLTVSGQGLQPGAKVVQVAGSQVTLSNNAIATYASTPVTFTNAISVSDKYGNIEQVSFSRPIPLLFYVTVTLVTDQYRTAGQPSSGNNASSRFKPGSMAQVQADIVRIGNQTPVGGLVVGFGTNGLIGAFNEIPGLVGYQVAFGTSPTPSSNANVQLLPTQVATFQLNLVSVSYT